MTNVIQGLQPTPLLLLLLLLPLPLLHFPKHLLLLLIARSLRRLANALGDVAGVPLPVAVCWPPPLSPPTALSAPLKRNVSPSVRIIPMLANVPLRAAAAGWEPPKNVLREPTPTALNAQPKPGALLREKAKLLSQDEAPSVTSPSSSQASLNLFQCTRLNIRKLAHVSLQIS